MVSMIHKKCVLSFFAAIFITIGVLQKRGTTSDNPINSRDAKITFTKLIEHLRQRVEELSVSLDRLWCKTQHIGSTGGFCLSEHNINVGGNSKWDVKLCQALEVLFGNATVVDFGAGLGHYGRCFLRKKESIFNQKEIKQAKHMDDAFILNMGKLLNKSQVIQSWNGYDGAINVEYLSKGFIKQQDLSIKELWLGRTWDWVLSLEIGEHIPSLYEDDFVDNLVRHGCKGIVLSWALENQGGHHHVNGHSNAYIKKKMADLGMVSDIQEEEQIRNTVDISYFKRTLMVFRFNEFKKCMNDQK